MLACLGLYKPFGYFSLYCALRTAHCATKELLILLQSTLRSAAVPALQENLAKLASAGCRVWCNVWCRVWCIVVSVAYIMVYKLRAAGIKIASMVYDGI